MEIGEVTQRRQQAVRRFERVGEVLDAAVGEVQRGEGGEARQVQLGTEASVVALLEDVCTAQRGET